MNKLILFNYLMATRVVSTIVCNDFRDNGCTLCISKDGRVYSCGKHDKGAHGHEEDLVNSPTVISSLLQITSVSCGVDHSLFLDIHGNVFSTGENDYGQLGVGKESSILEFTSIPQKLNIPTIKQISCGYDFSICLSENGILYSFGDNRYGQLGNGKHENCNYPKQIESVSDIEFVECGGFHAICKSVNNQIFVWGDNENGQLGTGNVTPYDKPYLCLEWPNNVVDIKCGNFHTIVLTSNQQVFSCGCNEYDALGRNTELEHSPVLELIEELSEIVRIECGSDHSMCIDDYDRLFLFGNNDYGQLGLNDRMNRPIPIPHPILKEVMDISSYGNHSFVKTISNEIYAFGKAKSSQLGIEMDIKYQQTPIRVFKDEEDIWYSNIKKKSKAKSARK